MCNWFLNIGGGEYWMRWGSLVNANFSFQLLILNHRPDIHHCKSWKFCGSTRDVGEPNAIVYRFIISSRGTHHFRLWYYKLCYVILYRYYRAPGVRKRQQALSPPCLRFILDFREWTLRGCHNKATSDIRGNIQIFRHEQSVCAAESCKIHVKQFVRTGPFKPSENVHLFMSWHWLCMYSRPAFVLGWTHPRTLELAPNMTSWIII